MVALEIIQYLDTREFKAIVSMVVFAVLFVVSTLLLIIRIEQYKKLRKDTNRLKKSLRLSEKGNKRYS